MRAKNTGCGQEGATGRSGVWLGEQRMGLCQSGQKPAPLFEQQTFMRWRGKFSGIIREAMDTENNLSVLL